VNVVIPTVDGVDVYVQFGCFVYNVAVEPGFDLWLDEVFAVFGCPYEVIVETPKGHFTPPLPNEFGGKYGKPVETGWDRHNTPQHAANEFGGKYGKPVETGWDHHNAPPSNEFGGKYGKPVETGWDHCNTF
jgi:hypothetical protein